MPDYYDLKADAGAAGDGSTDDTTEIQTALDAVRDSGTRRLYIPPGDYVVSGPLDMDGHVGTTIFGSKFASRFVWKGGSSAPMLNLAGSRECEIRELRLGPAATSFPLLEAIRMEQDGLPGSGTSSMNRFRDLHIDGLGVMTQGIRMKGDRTDANNDFSVFEGCYIAGYSEAGIVLQGANCLANVIRQCQIAGGRKGSYGIKATSGAGGQSGHFSVYGGAVMGHMQADFYLEARCALPVLVENVWSEGSERCFLTGGPTGSLAGIVVRGVQWASDQKSEGYEVIDIRMPGPVLLEHCILGSEYNKAVRIRWSYTPGYFAPSFRVIGCRVLGNLDSATKIFNGTLPPASARADSYWQTSDIAYGSL
jgi:hypothetical protein